MLARVLFSRVAAAIGIGMLATIATAWGAAIGSNWPWNFRQNMVQGTSHKTVPAWEFTQVRTPAGVTNQCRPLCSQIDLRRREGANSHLVDSWSMMRTPPTPGLLDEESLRYVWFTETVVGWPMLALATNSVHDSRKLYKPGATASSLIESRWAIAVGIHGKLHQLPLRPMPLGFAVNTLAFGSIAWPVLTAVAALRRSVRRRRGGCARCGYAIDAAGGLCPECGTQNHPRGTAPNATTPTDPPATL